MLITILTDNNKSWFVPFGYQLKSELEKMEHKVVYIFDKNDILIGDLCFLLSCSRIVEKKFLEKNKSNIVVHASNLPKGKGFAPLQWQILEGKNEIPLTLFEVSEKVDAGPYYLKDVVKYNGAELYEELRKKLAEKIIDMCLNFINKKNQLFPITQDGEETFYKKRTLYDDEIDPNKTIAEQFNHFRIADNENFPVYFNLKGHKYVLKIHKQEDENSNFC